MQAAVSSKQGQEEFVRVLGNTTGSHLAGAKPAPYGPLEMFQVTLESIHPILEWADFVKIDVEGHELGVIKGAEETIRTLYPTLIIEIFELTHVKEIYGFLTSIGYTVFGDNFGSENILTQVKTIDFLDTYKASDYLFVYQKEVIDGLIEKHF